MKKYIVAALVLGLGVFARAGVTLDFTMGFLTTAGGGGLQPDNSLIQVIGSVDNAFAAPTPASFIGGNDVLLFSGNFDSTTTGTPGTMQIFLNNVSAANFFLMVRWYPTLSGGAGAPGGSTTYGEYSSLNDISWVAPASGSQSYSMVTVSAGGSLPDSTGYASNTTSAVPEPSTYAAIFGALSLGLVAWRRRQQQAA